MERLHGHQGVEELRWGGWGCVRWRHVPFVAAIAAEGPTPICARWSSTTQRTLNTHAGGWAGLRASIGSSTLRPNPTGYLLGAMTL